MVRLHAVGGGRYRVSSKRVVKGYIEAASVSRFNLPVSAPSWMDTTIHLWKVYDADGVAMSSPRYGETDGIRFGSKWDAISYVCQYGPSPPRSA